MADKTIEEITEVEFFGIELQLKDITNPHLRRVLTDKRLSGYNEEGQYRQWTDDYWDQPYQDKS